MFSAALYAHVRNFLPIAHETAGAARIRHSLRPLFGEGGRFQQTSGAMRREIAATYSVVIARPRPGDPDAMVRRSGGEGVELLGRRDHTREHPHVAIV